MRWTIIVFLVFTSIVVSLGDDNMSHKCMHKNCNNVDADFADNSEENDKDGQMEDRGGRMLAIVIPVVVAIVIMLIFVGCFVYLVKCKQRITQTNHDCGKGEMVSVAVLPDSVTEYKEKHPLPKSNCWNPPSTTASAPTAFSYVPTYHSDVKFPPTYFPVTLDTMLQPPPPYSKI